MDSPESEWEIQQSSGGNSSNNGKLCWMLRLGKKILVSGIVISSAPLVLPPLMAISAIGFACSVPYGVFLVSYACTQTVMNRLLPMPLPASPLLVEYRKELDHGEEEADWDEKLGGQNEVIKGGIDMEREEEEFKKDTIQEVKMRLELVDKEEEELDERNIVQEDAFWKGGAEIDQTKTMEEVEEKGYEEDNGVFLDKEEERSSQIFEVEVDEIIELKTEQPIIEDSGSEQPASEGHFEAVAEEDEKHSSSVKKNMPLEAANAKEDEELVREKRGLLGRNRDENISNYARDVNQNIANVDEQRIPTKKMEGTAKGKGEKSVPESMNKQPGDEIHGFMTTMEDDEKERVNENTETSSEMKNVPIQIVQSTDMEKAGTARESGSSKRNRKKGRNRKVTEDKPGVEKAKVNVGGVGKQPREFGTKLGGLKEVKVEQVVHDESMSKKPIEEVSTIMVEFEGGEKNDSKNDKEMPFHMKDVTVQLSKSPDIEEDKELVRETRGLLEKIRDEGQADYAMDSKWSTEKEPIAAKKDDKKIVGDVEKAKRSSAHACEKRGKPNRKFEPKGEELKEEKKVLMKVSGENVDVVSKETNFCTNIEGLSENMEVDNISSKGPVSEIVKDGSSTKELIEESAISRRGGQGEDGYNAEQNYLLNREKKEATVSNEGEREINDEKLDLLDELSTVSQQGSPSDMNTLEESLPSSSHSVYQETSDSSELPVSTKAQESDDIQISAGNAIDTASNEAMYNKQKIWEQIKALRTIVGYQAAPQETCIDELKALYLFTGIEPPASFQDTSDLAEVNSKLRFLMSVVGVK
ncbi:hypothetical protein CCACVL1_06719 [Corchorus capsularis]|uniref:Uncharacterized protein n=1 Tax=Corchorus capsularis TaxID=210143 RepID=A0A1R3JDN2_COCAP|nr:hypothetical protein CCACVL1_06719 [Corchorus capsularis]